MIVKNRQAKMTTDDIEMAVRAVEGIPNAMDMDFSGVDPDPTSLDLAAEGDGFFEDSKYSNHQHLVDECIACRQPLAEE
jgi:hypothetical protein